MHSQSISLFIRDGVALTDEEFFELTDTLHDKVPEHDFSLTHKQIILDHEKCPKGDLFEHPSAVSQEEF